MQGHSFWILFARFISSRLTASNRRSAPEDAIGISASPILIFIALTLFFGVAILEIDLNREQLRALGLIFDNEGSSPLFAP